MIGHILPDAISLGRDKAKAQASGLFMPFNPDYAARKFAEDARRRACEMYFLVLQMPDLSANRQATSRFGKIGSPFWASNA